MTVQTTDNADAQATTGVATKTTDDAASSASSTPAAGAAAGATRAKAHRPAGVTEGFPITEQELAATVRSSPTLVNGKLLVEGLTPATHEHEVVKVIAEKSMSFLGHNGTTTVVNKKGEPYPVHFSIHKAHLFHFRNVFILRDENDKPIALVKQENKPARNVEHKTYGIYGTQPLHADDATVAEEAGVTFYPWFRYEEMDEYHQAPRLISVYSADGKYEPMWRASRNHKNQGEIVITSDLKHQAPSSHKAIVGYMIHKDLDDRFGWEVTMAAGVDPALMLCLTAILDDTSYFSTRHNFWYPDEKVHYDPVWGEGQ